MHRHETNEMTENEIIEQFAAARRLLIETSHKTQSTTKELIKANNFIEHNHNKIEKYASAGNVDAQFEYARYLAFQAVQRASGQQAVQELLKAQEEMIKWTLTAAINGHLLAQFNVARYLLNRRMNKYIQEDQQKEAQTAANCFLSYLYHQYKLDSDKHTPQENELRVLMMEYFTQNKIIKENIQFSLSDNPTTFINNIKRLGLDEYAFVKNSSVIEDDIDETKYVDKAYDLLKKIGVKFYREKKSVISDEFSDKNLRQIQLALKQIEKKLWSEFAFKIERNENGKFTVELENMPDSLKKRFEKKPIKKINLKAPKKSMFTRKKKQLPVEPVESATEMEKLNGRRTTQKKT